MHLVKTIGGWRSRKMIHYFYKLCKVLFTRYKGLVKYWITFNEINMILHFPFVAAGLSFEENENKTQAMLTAVHHQLVASALATKLAHEVDSENQIGCMLAAGSYYPETCRPEDYWKAICDNREVYMFADVQARGSYPNYCLKWAEKRNAKIPFVEGDVEHWWHAETGKGIRTRISDDLLWLVYLTTEYINSTNDYSILDIETPYIQGKILQENEMERYDKYTHTEFKESIYKHCIKAIEKTLNFGKNGLPKIGTGDWNDGLSNVGSKGIGESIWLGFFLYNVLDRFIPVCEYKGDNELAQKYEEIKNKLKKSLNTNGWDGRWYKRAYTDDGDALGSMENDECRIDSIAQSWSVISNAGDYDKKYISMESLENHLIDRENGIIKLLDPPFEKGKLEPGYIKAYMPGVRENGGQYTHECCC